MVSFNVPIVCLRITLLFKQTHFHYVINLSVFKLLFHEIQIAALPTLNNIYSSSFALSEKFNFKVALLLSLAISDSTGLKKLLTYLFITEII